MKEKRIRFSKEEDNIIATYIAKNPYNLRRAFRKTAKILNRSEETIAQRYYKYIKNDTTLFNITEDSNMCNVKNDTYNENIIFKVVKQIYIHGKIIQEVHTFFDSIKEAEEYLNNHSLKEYKDVVVYKTVHKNTYIYLQLVNIKENEIVKYYIKKCNNSNNE